MSLQAVDLFAGTGWGVACQRLGISEVGVELMPEARATREANGMTNWLADVWEVLEHAPVDSPEFRAALLIASPPCQTFSMAGSGKGRAALDEVIGLIDSRAYLDPAELRAFGETHDPRTALVLTPLTYVARHLPTFVVLEQVPPVLPVWQRYAEELRRWGYSVWVGILNAEQYGVPQTRKRAVLIARADGIEAAPPTPTHSRYYPRDKTKLDEGVTPWVSMAEALGWGMTERPYLTLAGGGPNTTHGGGHTGAQDPAMLGGSGARKTVADERERGAWVQGQPYNEGAPITLVNGTGANAARRNGDEPAPTMHFGQRLNSVTLVSNDKLPHSARRAIEEPAPTMTAGHDSSNRVWEQARQDRAGTTRVTVAEAAALQSYPADFDWETGPSGKPLTKTKAFLQIGNAVPPKLAEAILATFL